MTFTVSPANGVKSLGNSSTANVGGADTLNGGIDDTTTTIILNDSSMFPTAGTMKIEDEYITFTSNNGTELSGGVRGAFNSTAVSHTGTTTVIGVYIGISELNTQPDVMVSLKSDTSGTEHLDFSVDNVLWDTFPVSGFQASANIHEFHIAVKGVRYFRIRFENGSAAATTAFRVNTYFGVFRQGNLPLNQSVGADSDSTIVRAVGLGEQPDGTYRNDPANGQAFKHDTDLTLNQIITSPWIDTHGYNIIETFITSDVISDPDGVVFEFTDDLSAQTVQFTDTFTFSATELSEGFVNLNVQPKLVGFRIKYNAAAATITPGSFLIQIDLKINGNATARLDAVLTGKEDVQNVRSVTVGEQPDGTFTNSKSNGVLFVTNAVLANGVTYDSGCVSLVGYQQVQTGITSSHDGTIEINFYADEGCADLVRSLTIPYKTTDGFELFSAPTFSDYVVYKFTNTGGSIQTDFHYETKVLTSALSGQVLSTVATIVPQMVANLGRNILVGQEPDETFANQRIDGVAFRTEVPLTAGTINVYTSPLISLAGYSQIETHLFADTAGTLVGTWYNDSGETNVLRTFTRPYANGEVGTASYFSSPVFGPYVKYVYTNTGGDQSVFFLDFHLRIKAISGQVLGINDFIPSSVVANLGRNVIVGQQPDGNFKNNPHNGVGFTTTALLGIGATYDSSTLSEWTDTDGYNSIELFITTDVISAVNGIKIEFTDNLVNETVRETHYYTYGSIDIDRGHLEISITPKLVGFRILYINGNVGQSTFLLQTDLKTNGNSNKYDEGGALIVGDSKTEIALGNVPNHQISEQFGIVLNVDAADAEKTIWPLANDDAVAVVDRKTFNTAAELIYISSTNAGDTTQEITMKLIDSTGAEQVVTITLNGQTPVSTGITGLDCNDAFLSSEGDTLAGNIYIALGNSVSSGIPTNTADILSYIQASYARSMQSTYRVPINENMIITNIYATISRANGSPSSATVFLRTKLFTGSWLVKRPFIITTTSIISKTEEILLTGGSFVEFTIDDVSDNDTSCNVEFEYQLIKV